MTTYNDAAYISHSVKSILDQTYNDFEFLIIDDGSDDNTGKIITCFNDPRINYKKIEHTGLAGALNFGLKNSSGDLIARIDADDLSTPERLKTQIEFMRSNPDTDVLSGWSVYFKDKNKILFTIKPPSDDKSIKEFLNIHNPVNHSAVIYKKEKILDEGGYNEDFGCYEDFELWFRLRDKLQFRILPEVMVYTRMRSNSLSSRGSSHKIYEVLRANALSKSEKTDQANEKKFWNNILFWIEYFYGSKSVSRQLYAKDITFKKSLAYLNTFFPESIFEKITALRLRHRLQSVFEDVKEHREKLSDLLK